MNKWGAYDFAIVIAIAVGPRLLTLRHDDGGGGGRFQRIGGARKLDAQTSVPLIDICTLFPSPMQQRRFATDPRGHLHPLSQGQLVINKWQCALAPPAAAFQSS